MQHNVQIVEAIIVEALVNCQAKEYNMTNSALQNTTQETNDLAT